jgi:hypothetical protein
MLPNFSSSMLLILATKITKRMPTMCSWIYPSFGMQVEGAACFVHVLERQWIERSVRFVCKQSELQQTFLSCSVSSHAVKHCECNRSDY